MDIQALVDRTEQVGALVSYRTNQDGRAPYELNTTYFDALAGADRDDLDDEDFRRFAGAHATMLAQPGVPAIYLSSLFGGRNRREGPTATGQNRSINRGQLDAATIDAALEDPLSSTSRVFNDLGDLLRVRRGSDAFRPDAPREVLPAPSEVFALVRRSPTTKGSVVCLHNVSERRVPIGPDLAPAGGRP